MTSPSDSVSFTVRIPRKLNAELERIAKDEYSSKNREATIAIRAHIDSYKRARRNL